MKELEQSQNLTEEEDSHTAETAIRLPYKDSRASPSAGTCSEQEGHIGLGPQNIALWHTGKPRDAAII